jgi:hypothetical protein
VRIRRDRKPGGQGGIAPDRRAAFVSRRSWIAIVPTAATHCKFSDERQA